MKKILCLSAFFFSLASNADPGFECYQFPGVPVQTFQYSSSNCGVTDSAGMANHLEADKVGKSDVRDVLCTYQAFCKVVADGTKVPANPPLNEQKFTVDMQSGKLKQSMLLCKGHGTIEDGVIVSSDCPPPNECQRDVFFNFAPAKQKSDQIMGVGVHPDPKRGRE